MRILTTTLLMCLAISAMSQKATKYSLDTGDKFVLTSVADQNIEQMQVKLTQKVMTQEEIEVIGFEDGIYTMKSTNLMQSFCMSGGPMPAQTMHSDSTGLMNLPFRIMKGLSYTFKMTETGKVTAVMGLEEIRKSMTEQLQGTIYGPTADQITGVYDETTLKDQLNVAFNFYSDENKDEWSNEYKTVVNNIPITFTTSLYWDDEDTIFGTSDIAIDGTVEIQGTSVSMVLNGDQKAIIDLDASNGMPTKVQTVQEISGNMQAQGQTVPMSITTETTVTIIKK